MLCASLTCAGMMSWDVAGGADGRSMEATSVSSTKCWLHGCCIRNIFMAFQYYLLTINGLPQIHVSRQRRNMQLDPSCVSAPPATSVDLLACFAERSFKLFKGQKKATASCHTPNRVYTK